MMFRVTDTLREDKLARGGGTADCGKVPTEALVVSTLDVSIVIASVEFLYSFWCSLTQPFDCLTQI